MTERVIIYDVIHFQCGTFLTLIKMKDPFYAWLFSSVNGTTHHLTLLTFVSWRLERGQKLLGRIRYSINAGSFF